MGHTIRHKPCEWWNEYEETRQIKERTGNDPDDCDGSGFVPGHRQYTGVCDIGTRVEPTCEKKDSVTYKCTKCGEVMDVEELAATGHKWDAGKVTKEPTETAEGVKTYTCSVCGKTKTEAIPKKVEAA